MSNLAKIPGITGPILALLNAAGYRSPEDVCSGPPAEILAKLELANAAKQLVPELPTMKAVTSWQRTARTLQQASQSGNGPGVSVRAAAKAREAKLEPARIIAAAELRKAGISVSAVPIAQLIEDEVEVSKGPARVVERSQVAAKAHERIANDPAPVDRPEGMRFKPMEEAPKSPPETLRRNAGMSHYAPAKVWFAAASTLLSQFLFVVGVLGTAVVVVMAKFWSVSVPKEAVAVPALIPIALLLYGVMATKARCRLCGQRVFVPKGCLKHVRADRSIFGYVFAAALRAVFTLSFRCMLCGTKIRLEKKEATPADGNQ